VTDVVTPAISATVDCGVTFPHTLAAGGELVCSYDADLPDGTSRTNTATVTTSGDVGGDTATADVTFGDPTTVVNGSVNVDDTNDDGDAGPFTGSNTYTYDLNFTCDEDEGQHDNTATIVETGQSDDATVIVECEAPPQEEDGEWCSPGFWRNHQDLWQSYWNVSYNDVTDGEDFEDDPTLLEVIENPQMYGGTATNLAADYISTQLGLNFTGERVDNCPLE
jgi:hypothetical protein